MEKNNIALSYNLTPLENNFSINFDDMKKVVSPSPIVVGGLKEIDVLPTNPVTIEKYLLMHPVVPTGIDVRANKLVGKGYNVSGQHEEARKYCEKILTESGGLNFIKRWYKNTIAWGSGFVEIVPNRAGNEILKCDVLHPVYFNFLKQKKQTEKGEQWITVIDNKTKRPKGFSQYIINQMDEWESTGPIIAPDRIGFMALDTWGDEFEGTSVITYLQQTMDNLFNTESAGAQAAFISANPRYAFSTNIQTPNDLKEFGDAVKSINEKDVIVLTEGTDVKVLQPGITNFPEYHKRFLLLIASKLQIPLPLLISDATSTNKATLDKQLEFLNEQLVSDEYIIKASVERQIFETACKVKFGADFSDDDLPSFNFNPFIDTKREIELVGEKTKLVERLARSVKMMDDAGRKDVADLLVEQMKELYDNGLLSEETRRKTKDVQKKASAIKIETQ